MSMIVHGTEDTSSDPIPATVGDWSLLLVGGAVRTIRWRGVEVVRAIDCPVRDATWGTLVQEDVHVAWADDGARRVLTRTFALDGGALRGTMTTTIDPAGTLQVDARLDARDTFRTNRSGLTVLHPIRGVAGTPLAVHHASGGDPEATRFPLAISPAQPAFDIAGLDHVVDGVRVAIAFEGETFEMEDQRNWADASYKTYCRPLARPMPYEIVAGSPVHHRVRVTVSGDPSAPVRPAAPPPVAGQAFPEVLVVAEEGWVPGPGHPAHEVGTGTVVIRLSARHAGAEAWVGAAARAATGVDLEIVIPEGADPDAHLKRVAAAVAAHGIAPRHAFALPEAYLRSYQPDGRWPTGTTPADASRAAARAFPHARIGVGMLTNFTEVNRCRPGPFGDYLTHSTTAIVHAADDGSVFETLETLPRILADDAAFARKDDGTQARTVRIGLAAIGSRGNAFGAVDAPNPGRVRKAMATADPRQVGLVAAAYAVGVASAMAAGGAEAFAPAALAGPFGVASDTGRYPVHAVVRALRRFSGRPVAPVPPLPEGAHGVAVAGDAPGEVRAMIANATATDLAVALPPGATWRRLDEWSAPAAATDPGWLDGPVDTVGADEAVALPRHAVVFAAWAAGAA